MKYYIPTKVYQEDNCIWNHRKEIAFYGNCCLIITGKSSSKKNGSLPELEEALKAENVKYIIFDKVEENPAVETVVEASQLGIAEGAEFVVGLGGGSPMDAAKAAALLIRHPDRDGSFLFAASGDDTAIPVIAIPTTCGTGSEVTGVSVLTVHDKKTKSSISHRVFPALALADGKYLAYASKKIIRDTAIDALSHMWESYVNTMATPFSNMFVEKGLRIWRQCIDVLKGEREATLEDYNKMLTASTLAGMAIAHTGTTIPHSLSYAVTYELGIAHGPAVGRFLAGYLQEADEKTQKKLLELSGFDCLEEFDHFFTSICELKALSDELTDRIVETVYARKEKLLLCPYELDEKKLYRMVKHYC
ncbi:MAG: iron-containing alcohol dehydrogenase family protein [Wujia sp.]